MGRGNRRKEGGGDGGGREERRRRGGGEEWRGEGEQGKKGREEGGGKGREERTGGEEGRMGGGEVRAEVEVRTEDSTLPQSLLCGSGRVLSRSPQAPKDHHPQPPVLTGLWLRPVNGRNFGFQAPSCSPQGSSDLGTEEPGVLPEVPPRSPDTPLGAPGLAEGSPGCREVSTVVQGGRSCGETCGGGGSPLSGLQCSP